MIVFTLRRLNKMVNGTAKLIIDFGNSSTRIQTKFGNTQKGNPRVKTVEVSNSFARMSEEEANRYIAEGVYTEEDSRIFVSSAGDIYCNGDICTTEYEKTAERPSAVMSKYRNINLKWSVLAAFCIGYKTIAEFTNSDIDSIDVDWEVTALLPPDDIDEGAPVVAEMIKSITKAEFKMPEFTKDIKVNSVKVFPEGYAAFIAVLFEGVGKIREDYKYLTAKGVTTLIVDIGAGTTDFLLVRNGKVVQSSRFTRSTGGNNVHQTLRRILKRKGIALKDSAAREGSVTGYVYSGAEKISIIDEIAEAKMDVSRDLIDALVEFFESTMIEVQSINYILTVGGGAVESDVEGIEPISKYLYEYIKSISSRIGQVELPKMEKGDKKMESRMANVIGAGILAG